MKAIRLVLATAFACVVSSGAWAQVQTGSIVGAVSDSSGGVLPGVTVTLGGERLIGGVQTFTTDENGSYRFDRLPPGEYLVKFELPGFKTVERAGIRINAAFTATVNAKLEVGSLEETITVTGESPTVDTKSNLQQTVMSQEILEGVPTGRDPWSLAKIIPGVNVSTYDVGGTQSMQQSGLTAHGSSGSDVSFNIDGATVNWPGGGGGSTMMYYDQGMFEEVNYMTSAIPAEVMAGGVSINMVTKDAGNVWRGNLRYSFANDSLQSENHLDIQRELPSFLGNPTLKTYDFNISGGGAIVRDRLWVNGTVRRWIVNKLTNARNLDGSQALDDNTLKNYSGKATMSFTPNQKLMVSYLWNDKIRGHRRNGTDLIPDIAAIVQTNPVQTTQAKYTGVFGARLVYESAFSVMDGQTNYTYQPDVDPNAIRRVDFTIGAQDFAAPAHQEQPNSRHQFDNTLAYNVSGFGGDHFFKTGVQFGRLYYAERYTVQGHHYVEYSNGVPNRIRLFNTPNYPRNLAHVLGFFIQDAWSVGSRLTLNLGMRFDNYKGILPDQSNTNIEFDLFDPGPLDADGTGPYGDPRTVANQEVLNQSKGVWRAGAVYDLAGDGRTALKASYSRYALQVGINRVTSVNPLGTGSRTCPWSDPNGDGRFQASEITLSQCSAFSGGINTFYAEDGVDWPYSDEVTAGIERQVGNDMRVGAMFYYRANRDQIGDSNVLVPTSAYTAHEISVPDGPNGATTATLFNLDPSFVGLARNIRDNQPILDTDYKGIEFTASKRFSRNWQMVAGLTLGRNEGGLADEDDVNDPNFLVYDRGAIGNDTRYGFRLSGSYLMPGGVSLAGSFVANDGYPFVSTYNVSRAVAARQGIRLTRSSQSVRLSRRGDERLPSVKMMDLRISRPIRFGDRRIVPQLDIFNITNAATVVNLQTAVGGAYLNPREILSPRIIRIGFSLDF
jgi:catechol 2,3-dioxygenase-like lactoylglutathione lyase family enzyme